MAETLTLDSVTQEQFDTAEQTLLSLIRAAYPQLDLRRGTVLRETYVRPSATVAGLEFQRVENLRRLTSLLTMIEDGTATAEDVNKVLANFNMTQYEGRAAAGMVQVIVDSQRTYTIPAGTVFTTLSGLNFLTDASYTVKTGAGAGELELHQARGLWYFTVPVTAEAAGTAYNITQSTALEPKSSLYGFVTASAASNFTSGLDGETLAGAASRIPAALSHRGLTNATAVEAMLRARFDTTVPAIMAVSLQGFGDAAMLRDKHNVFGTAVGGRADIYARTFAAPATVTLTKTGTRQSDGSYTFSIGAGDAPGFYAVRSISDPGGVALGSYRFTDIRGNYGADDTWHDIEGDIESAFTVFQTATVNVTEVPDGNATHDFNVEVYVAPLLADIQAYVDDPSVRNSVADFLVRCPPVCLVSVSAIVYYDLRAPVDLEALKRLLADYINSRSFVPRLTRSELVSVLLQSGVKRVDLEAGNMRLTGRVLGADCVWRTLSGDSLNIAAVAAPAALITADTVVFGAEVQDIQLTGVGE